MSLIALLQRLARCTSGTATLEAAILLPVAIMLLAGGAEFGKKWSDYGTASKSVRDAARYLARVPQAGLCPWGKGNATNLAIYGNLQGTGAPLILTTATVTFPNIDCNNPSNITVQADINYTPLMFSAIPGYLNGNLSSISSIDVSVWTISVKHQEPWIGE